MVGSRAPAQVEESRWEITALALRAGPAGRKAASELPRTSHRLQTWPRGGRACTPREAGCRRPHHDANLSPHEGAWLNSELGVRISARAGAQRRKVSMGDWEL